MRLLGEDLVRVYGRRYDTWTKQYKDNKVVSTLYWGDEVSLVKEAEADDPSVGRVRVRYYVPGLGKDLVGEIRKKSAGRRNGKKTYRPIRWLEERDPGVLKVTFVDVQQGDATLVQTPSGKVLLIDGGEGKFIARLLAALFPGSTEANPFVIDALVITHGDADHFSGLNELAKAAQHRTSRKRIHARVARYFHNGIVKAGGEVLRDGQMKSRREKEKLGDFHEDGDHVYVTSVFTDPRKAPSPNGPFQRWFKSMETLLDTEGLGPADKMPGERLPRIERMEFGNGNQLAILGKNDSHLAFDVLGPLVDRVNEKPALEMLEGENGGLSAGHTINGHSIVLKMRYGNVNFMLGGDLNTPAAERLLHHLAEHGGPSLRSEILKVPHHGSHEFAPEFLDKVAPVVSVVSSGDENVMKEYVHPRANLMAALGRYSRGPLPLVFSTELAAFFAYRGPVQPEKHKPDGSELAKKKQRGKIHAFQRLVFGAVRVRTNGARVLCAVESANDGIKEAYAFTVSEAGDIEMDNVSTL